MITPGNRTLSETREAVFSFGEPLISDKRM